MDGDIGCSVQTKAFRCEPFKLRLLRKPETVQHFQNIFQQNDLNVELAVRDSELVISGFGAVNLSDIFTTVSGSLDEQKIHISVVDSSGKQTPEWNNLFSDLLVKFPSIEITLDADTSSLTCSGISDDVTKALSCIQHFQRREHFFEMSQGKVKYIQQHMLMELQQIVSAILSDAVKVETVQNEKNGVMIRGSTCDLEQVNDVVLNFSENIMEVVHETEAPGIAKHFLSKRGQHSIDAIQYHHSVVILSSFEKSGAGIQSSILRSQVTVGSGNNLVVKVVKGDITCYRTDGIVVSIPDDLKFSSGVAKVVVDRSGNIKAVEDEIQDHIKRHKPIAGQIIPTGPGRLKHCSAIIFAVVKSWQGGAAAADERLNVLNEAVYRSLVHAERTGLSSIAIADVGCGLDVNVSLPVVLNVIETFQSRTVKEVILIDNSDRIVSILRENVEKQFAKTETTQPLSTEHAADCTTSWSGPSKTAGYVASRYVKTANPLVLSTPEGVTVTLFKGAIASQKTDVILNTISSELDLNRGGVSSSLLQAAGQGLQDDWTKMLATRSDMTPHSVIFLTGGHKLACKKVYHASFKKWDDGAGPCEKIMRSLLGSALTQADRERMTSIAIPAIGTGGLRIPADVACRVMFDEVDKFSENNPRTTLRDVRFIVYEKDCKTSSAFEQYIGVTPTALLQGLLPSGSPRSGQSLVESSPTKGSRGGDKVPVGVECGAAVVDKELLSKVVFRIYSTSQDAISKAIREIEEVVEEASTAHDVPDGAEDQTRVDESVQNQRLPQQHGLKRAYKNIASGPPAKHTRLEGPPTLFATPSTWTPVGQGTGMVVATVEIFRGSKEYGDVEKNIRASVGSLAVITKIERIQNPGLYQQYQMFKSNMTKSADSATHERILWHGTSAEAVEQINIHGFNRSYCGKNATSYGKGVYFARNWSYSAKDKYSPPDRNGRRRIYQARVLTGDFTVGNSGLIDTPLKAPSGGLRYDSVVNNVNNPEIFVIFRDAQAYPEYLITFT